MDDEWFIEWRSASAELVPSFATSCPVLTWSMMKFSFSKMTAGEYFNIAYVALFVVVTIGVVVLMVVDRINHSKTGEGITSENIDKLKKGMTEGDVLEILGCPPGWYAGPGMKSSGTLSASHRKLNAWQYSATGIALVVDFNSEQPRKVIDIYVRKSKPRSPLNNRCSTQDDILHLCMS